MLDNFNPRLTIPLTSFTSGYCELLSFGLFGTVSAFDWDLTAEMIKIVQKRNKIFLYIFFFESQPHCMQLKKQIIFGIVLPVI